MAEYDFHQLSSHDFEILARDLLQAHWNLRLQSFKAGKDGGMDLLYQDAAQKIVVQCKHYAHTGFSGLKRSLRNEVAKVSKLSPSRYVVVVSTPLSSQNKDEIVALFGAAPLSANDVIGREDLNNLLSLYPEIERNHYKLWLASKAVLDRALHSAIVNRSTFSAQKVHASIRRYVQTKAFPTALEILESHRVVILTGAPGVGKTTLADMLLFTHLSEGYEPVVIQHDLREAETMFQPDRKQIFYFDDFLGATFLHERGTLLSQNGDRALLDFIAMVAAAPFARFVLTTREHIFSQAVAQSERLRLSSVGDNKVVLKMADYTFEQKALILFNHLYFSDLPLAYREEILLGDFYLTIIRHQKFNPRLIEWLSSYQRVKSTPPEDYRRFVVKLLADPAELWRHAYEQQLSDAGRSLLLTVCSLGGSASISIVSKAFSSLHSIRAKRYGFPRSPDDFRRATVELNGAFIEPESPQAIGVLNPSVLDLFNTVVAESPENALDIISASTAFVQLSRLWRATRESKGQLLLATLHDNVETLATALMQSISEHLESPNPDDDDSDIYMPAESRLAELIMMADEFRHRPILEVVRALGTRMTESGNVVYAPEGARVLALLRDAKWDELKRLKDLRPHIRDASIEDLFFSTDLFDVSDLLDVLDLKGVDAPVRERLHEALIVYLQEEFEGELDDCQDEEEVMSLGIALENCRSSLGLTLQAEFELWDLAHKRTKKRRRKIGRRESKRLGYTYESEAIGEDGVRAIFSTLTMDHQ
ncbi:restriction endonuclease [Ralstonia sp.]|uniref:nSTAND3 domain-containing NTPase n=1 Tax=Ralstonia sp. TaxID=54061 RepID=UPI002C590F87|nr:restriction endonuclease [Ralstonia sp.]HWV04969.1 restriction endonuclease [Ralstonia sp.]